MTSNLESSPNLRYDFSGQNFIVIGGASGIGADVVRMLMEAGAVVDVLDRTAPAPGRAPSSFIQVDVRVAEAVSAAISSLVGERGRIDGLVYAVGVLDGYSSLKETTEELLETVVDINVFGAVRGIRAVVPAMQEEGYGRIVIFSSIASFVAGAGGLSYTMSKHAITGLVKHLALELGADGITVNAIAPGSIQGTAIRTTITEVYDGPVATNRGLGTRSAIDAARLYPVGRLGDIDAVVPTVALLLSRESWFITGTSSIVDGGYLAQ